MKPHRLTAFCTLLLLAGCAAASSPAIDSDFYEKYRGVLVTPQRDGFLVYYPGRTRGIDRMCFPPAAAAEVGGLSFGSQGFGPGSEVVRKIGAGEKIRVEEIVYFSELSGAWAQARLEGGEECVIQASRGLQMHLLLTAAEEAEWNTLPRETREIIKSRQIRRGLTKMQVLLAWGEPFKTVTALTPQGQSETWIYQRSEKTLTYLTFTGDVLEGWRE